MEALRMHSQATNGSTIGARLNPLQQKAFGKTGICLFSERTGVIQVSNHVSGCSDGVRLCKVIWSIDAKAAGAKERGYEPCKVWRPLA